MRSKPSEERRLSAKRLLSLVAVPMIATLVVACPPNGLLTDIQEEVNTAQTGNRLVATPTFLPSAGNYSSDTSVTIKDSTNGATIYYTTNDTVPSTSSTQYTGPISVAGNSTSETIEAIAVKSGMANSQVAVATYVINYSQVSTPNLAPNGGTITTADTVTISCGTTGATIAYTTDGTAPTESSGTITNGTQYVAPFTLPVGTDTVRALAFKSGMTDSNVSTILFAVTSSVYVAGYYLNGTGTYNIACYWINGTKTDLPGGTSGNGGYATSLSVSGGTVYTAGQYYNGTNHVACYWTGTTRTDLPGTAKKDAGASGIYVSGGTVYTAGYYVNSSGMDIPCYWTNGTTRTDLPCGSGGTASSIYVSGGAVYVGGYYYNGTTCLACYWTNGTTRTDLPGGTAPKGAFANSIYVSGGTVYTAGQYYNGTKWVACYWAGTTRTDLHGGGTAPTASAYAYSICVTGALKYTTGYYEGDVTNVACYWDLWGNRTDLSAPDAAYASGIYLSAGLIYTAGLYWNGSTNVACYWTGTTRTDLPGNNGSASSIEVQ